jgi:hypothetical protein
MSHILYGAIKMDFNYITFIILEKYANMLVFHALPQQWYCMYKGSDTGGYLFWNYNAKKSSQIYQVYYWSESL